MFRPMRSSCVKIIARGNSCLQFRCLCLKTRHAAQHTTGENTTNLNTHEHRGDLCINNIHKEKEDSSFLAQ
jgi:hypothetical protein